MKEPRDTGAPHRGVVPGDAVAVKLDGDAPWRRTHYGTVLEVLGECVTVPTANPNHVVRMHISQVTIGAATA